MDEQPEAGVLSCSDSKAGQPEPCPTRFRRFLQWLLWPVIVAAIGIALLATVAVLRYGSVYAGIARFQGHVLILDASVQSVGSVKPGEQTSTSFVITNIASGPVTIVGIKTDCGCITSSDLPLTLQPGEKGEVSLAYSGRSREARQTVSHTALLYLDTPSPPLFLRLTADVREATDFSATK